MNVRKLLLITLSVLSVSCSDDDEDSSNGFAIVGSTSSVSSFVPKILVNAGSPTSFKLTVYKAYLSTSATCSNPVLLQDYGASGSEFNMFEAPTLFSGTPSGGTYNCLILEISDNLKIKVDATAVTTHAGCVDSTTEYTHDIYRQGDPDDGSWIDINGSAVDATGSRPAPGADRIFAFASTSASAAGVVANGVAVHANQWMPLSGALTAPGQVTYFWDATDGISNANDGGTDYCVIEEVTQGFR